MQTAIITGASSGIGLEIARLYAKKGYWLTINGGHDKEALEKTGEELSALTRVETVLGDVGREEVCQEIADRTLDRYGRVDLVINNAGMARIGLLSDMTGEEWRRIMDTNLNSVFYMSRAVIPHMVHRKQGRILNISSIWGEVGASCEAAYSASKGGVNALTKALAKELAPSGISVNAISFGVVDTRMNACLSQEEKNDLAGEIPAGRFATAQEAAAFCWQVTESPAYLTGQIIRFDGGFI